ncbi:hypothetical protein RFI_03950 [Reticulomyxa filosa]|uniref:Uncharacterized protein n=1 Tax=Reticulomyxa filosa TaxID=46433 RepID=X6P4M1_RETFI|nr:hypothetical protein RFI_03950 [Reticulomyxa filosa]|eukprot:ETO33156.1 hypothetical protein RFI_03950 [Reticulomyxa filosa]
MLLFDNILKRRIEKKIQKWFNQNSVCVGSLNYQREKDLVNGKKKKNIKEIENPNTTEVNIFGKMAQITLQ